MSVEALSDYTSTSKYARYLKDKKRRETWTEAVDRNREMMLAKFPFLHDQVNWAYDFVQRKEVLPSMRAMQFGGAPMLKHAARGFNCCSAYCDRLRFFQECFYLLLCGCGTGFSVQYQHIKHMPRFSFARLAGRSLPRKVFQIPDCIEGWADAAGILLSSYHEEPIRGFEQFHDCEVEFDPTLIRPKGADLSCGIGKAPGSDPLMRSLRLARQVLDEVIRSGLTKLDSIHAYDFMMHLADAAVAGGVRRSASIAIFDVFDNSMASCKTGNWRQTNPQRARANNSVVLLRQRTTWEEFHGLFQHTKEYGEPGFYWTDDGDIVPNPCVEVGMYPRLHASFDSPLLASYQGPIYSDRLHNKKGYVWLSGWQFCNLTTINGKTIREKDDFLERCRAASTIGTYQASFTDFPYMGRITEEIARKEALLGVAICGMMHKPAILLDPAIQTRGAKVVLDTNEEVAGKIGINLAARATCIKPDGKSSAVLGSEPGIIPAHSKRHFRLCQANHVEPVFQHFKSVNPHACELSVWNKMGTDDVIRFPIEQPEGTVCKTDVSALAMLENIKTTYENWIQGGKRPERCVHPALSHNVSNTVHVRPHEWDEVAWEIYQNRKYYAGVSLVGDSCDRDYPQAPYTSVYTLEEQISMYGWEAVAESIELAEEGKKSFPHLWDACDLALGLWDRQLRPTTPDQEAWVHSLLDYANSHFGGDIKKASYAVKDRHNLAVWELLKQTIKPVDYSKMVEEEDGTTLQGEIACAGGVCVNQLG